MSPEISFPYRYVNGIFRPIITVRLAHGLTSLEYDVLIDSGADRCIINGDIGRALGLDIEQGDPFTFRGAVGNEKVGYFHTVAVEMRHACFQTRIGFTDHLGQKAHGMMGQKGFFDRFSINFDYSEQELTLHKKQWA